MERENVEVSPEEVSIENRIGLLSGQEIRLSALRQGKDQGNRGKGLWEKTVSG